MVSAAVAAVTATAMAGVPALAQGAAHKATPAATATPIIKTGYGTAGTVSLQCNNNAPSGSVSVNYIKITAIQAGTLTNVKLP